MKRGLTLFELVVSLSLLSAVMVVCLSWVQFAGRSSAQVAEPLRWRLAAEQLLSRLEEDALTGDFVRDGDAQGRARVFTDRGSLVISTRSRVEPRGSTHHEYRLGDDRRLTLQVNPLGRRAQPSPARTLLTDVAKFVFNVDDTSRRLEIRLVSMTGAQASRTVDW